MASGGRAGFKVGSPTNVHFQKMLILVVLLQHSLQLNLVYIGTGGKEATKQVVKESAKDVLKAPDNIFLTLQIKLMFLVKNQK